MNDTVEIPVPETLCGYCRIRLRAVPPPYVQHSGVWHHQECVEPAQIINRLRTEERDYLTRSEWEARATC